jgi:stage V sporulation protein G
MQITDVRIRKVEKEGKMKAVVSITIDEEFVVHDIKIIEGKKVFLLQCQVARLQMENTVILHIRSTQERESGSRN